jgi:uncharacterized protein YodC (DUF2158 family)
MEIKIGSVVKLNSGGPIMTVKGIVGDAQNALNKMENEGLKLTGHTDGDVVCQWFNDGNLESGVFKKNMPKEHEEE